MSSERKDSDARERDLRLAISRIQRGRSSTAEPKLTFAAVARQAGVSTALIHNCYPKVAELIREVQGRSSRAQRDAKHQQLETEREKSRQLRTEIEVLRIKVRSLASINEVLLSENRDLKARVNSPKIIAVTREHRGQ